MFSVVLSKAFVKEEPQENLKVIPSERLGRKIPHIEAVSAVIQKNGKVLLNQRPPTGLLGGLWEFPNWKIEEKKRLRLRLRLRNYYQERNGNGC